MFSSFKPKYVFSAILLDRLGFHNLYVENNILKKEYVSTTWKVLDLEVMPLLHYDAYQVTHLSKKKKQKSW